MSKKLDDFIEGFVKARDSAVIECWKSNSIEPLNRFVEEYKKESYDKWQNASEDVKWLTLCNMTMSITTVEVTKYIPNAYEKRQEIKWRYKG